MKEVLVQQDDIQCDRAAIRSLIPGTKMDAKVITSVCHQQTYIEMMLKGNIRKGGPLYFLPASLQDAAMKGLKPEKAFSDYQFSYLEAAGNCQEDAAMKGLKPEKAFSDYQFSYLEAAGNYQESVAFTFTSNSQHGSNGASKRMANYPQSVAFTFTSNSEEARAV
ncbi:hypothetical protein LINGRAHAP2_LOCUS14030 [Linum grandiflorum]